MIFMGIFMNTQGMELIYKIPPIDFVVKEW